MREFHRFFVTNQQLSDEGIYQPPAGKFDTIEVLENGNASLVKLDGSSAEFDPVGRLVARRDANKKEVLYRYDDEDRLTQIGDTHGRSLNLTYGLNGRVATVGDHSGRQWVYDYDAIGNLVSVTDPVGGVRKYDYKDYLISTDPQKWHQLTRITDASGVVVTEVTYNGHKVSSYTEGANRYSYNYDGRSSRVTKTDSLKSAWTFVYDSHGQIVTDTNPMGQSVLREYNSNGYQQKLTDAAGNHWSSQFDALGRKLSAVNPYEQTTQLEYKGDKPWPVKVTSPSGRASLFTYDDSGNLITMTDSSGAVTQMKWSDTGYPTQRRPRQHRHHGMECTGINAQCHRPTGPHHSYSVR